MTALRDDDRETSGILVDAAHVPGGGVLHLVRHGQDYEIMFGDEQLMGSWDHRSEQALATLVFERLGARAGHVLIGGLGMGFTLAAARSALPASASIVVAELVPEVLSWAKGALAPIFGESLDDPRVTVQIRDVHDVIEDGAGQFDAILLDVDNGPEGLISLANERLYCNWGIRSAFAALRPGGIFAVWSAHPDPDFAERLRKPGFAVEEVRVEGGSDGENGLHVIWLAFKSG